MPADMGKPLAVVLLALVAAMVLASSPAPPAQAAPAARFKWTPKRPLVGQKIKLDAGASTCRRCKFRWRVVRPARFKRVLGRGKVIRRKFAKPGMRVVQLTVITRDGRRDRKRKRLRVGNTPSSSPAPMPGPPPVPNLPPLGRPACAAGATQATSAGQVRSEVAAGRSVCVVAAVGNVNLDGLTSAAVRHVGTAGAGSMDEVHMTGASHITLSARIGSIVMRNSSDITIDQSRIGGEPGARTLDSLIFIPEPSDNVTIQDSDIGWTTSDNSGNTGYGIRIYNDSDNLTIQRNYIHHIGADAMQISISGENALIDRNEVAYAARPSGGNEHSDDLQMVGQGPNTRVTNNWFHHCGWWSAQGPTTGCNGSAIHAGGSSTFLYENNLEEHALGIHYVGALGTGGCNRSNTIYRRNTFNDMATQFGGATPDIAWGLCGGSSNVFERNVVVNRLGNENGFGASGTTARNNLVGNYAIDPATGNCTTPACSPAGQDPIGYRKPAGVHW
jgi:hypothetical protein